MSGSVNDFDEGLFDSLVSKLPESLRVYPIRYAVLKGFSDKPQYLDEVMNGLDADSEDVSIILTMAELNKRRGRVDEAKKYYDRAVDFYQRANMFLEGYELCLKIGDEALAEKFYKAHERKSQKDFLEEKIKRAKPEELGIEGMKRQELLLESERSVREKTEPMYRSVGEMESRNVVHGQMKEEDLANFYEKAKTQISDEERTEEYQKAYSELIESLCRDDRFILASLYAKRIENPELAEVLEGLGKMLKTDSDFIDY